jgi:hypothetical protein
MTVVDGRMRTPRFQFRLSSLLWLTLAVACWFGGMMADRRIGWNDLRRRERDLLAREQVVKSMRDLIELDRWSRLPDAPAPHYEPRDRR